MVYVACFLYIELPKFRKLNPNFSNELMQWLAFIDTENGRRLESIMKENKVIERALKRAKEFEADKKTRRIIELMEKKRLDDSSMIKAAKEEGIEQGIKQGIEEGIQQGKEQGVKEVTLKVINTMLKNNFTKEQIMISLDMSREELEELIKNK